MVIFAGIAITALLALGLLFDETRQITGILLAVAAILAASGLSERKQAGSKTRG